MMLPCSQEPVAQKKRDFVKNSNNNSECNTFRKRQKSNPCKTSLLNTGYRPYTAVNISVTLQYWHCDGTTSTSVQQSGCGVVCWASIMHEVWPPFTSCHWADHWIPSGPWGTSPWSIREAVRWAHWHGNSHPIFHLLQPCLSPWSIAPPPFLLRLDFSRS